MKSHGASLNAAMSVQLSWKLTSLLWESSLHFLLKVHCSFARINCDAKVAQLLKTFYFSVPLGPTFKSFAILLRQKSKSLGFSSNLPKILNNNIEIENYYYTGCSKYIYPMTSSNGM